jgi:Domain of unknown function (DUF4838)
MPDFNDRALALANSELSVFLKEFPEYNFEREFRIAADAPHGNVKCVNGKLIFVAPNAAEILYTVYAFAEKFLGWCFFEPGKDRFSPELAREITDGDLLELPAKRLKRRGFVQEFDFSEDSYMLADWMVRNGLNYLMVWMKYYDKASDKLKEYFAVRGIEIESGHHNFNYWIPPQKYFKEHPEFFAIIDGKRISPTQDVGELLLSEQLCTTNPDLRDEIVKNMIAYCKANPELKTISLLPNDGFGWCECERCSKFYSTDEKGELYSLSTHVYKADRIYHDMFNYVAEKLHAVLPDITLTMCAYVNYASPAEGFKLKDNSAVHFAPYWRCVNHEINDPSCPINKHYAEDVARWNNVKAGGEVNIYEYLMGVNFYISLPFVFNEEIFDEIDWFAANGVDGYLTQFHIPHWTVYGMNFYFMAKATRGEDKQASIDYLFKSVFGENAEKAKAFYKKMHGLVHSAGDCHITYPRALFNRTKVEQYEEICVLANELAQAGKGDSFISELPVWTEYLLRFKKLFDKYQNSKVSIEELDEFLTWIHSHKDSRVFVHDKIDMYFEAWKDAIKNNTEWIHFNIGWEDDYIRQHDKIWK